MGLSLTFLGPPRVEADGRAVELDTRKATALLAYLAVTGSYQRREALAALLWPEMDEDHGRAALRRTLSSLRAAVGDVYLNATRDGLSLNQETIACDVVAFERLAATARSHGHAGLSTCSDCLAALETAAGLYRDHFLAGFSLRDSAEFDDWQTAQTEYLRRELGNVLSALVAARTATGDYPAALAHAQRWLALDPLREEVHRALMQLHAWSGRRDAALRQYRAAVRILDEELGVEPLPETRALYEAIQEGRLPRPEALGPATGVPEADVPAAGVPAADAHLPLPAHPQTVAESLLIGRDDALEKLRAAYRESASGGRMAAIVGEAGIGKTHLVDAFLRQARAGGAHAVLAPCYEGEATLAFAPFTAALQALLRRQELASRLQTLPAYQQEEIARLLPELGIGRAVAEAPPATPGAQARFFAAAAEVLCNLLAGPQPGILALDDVHWADAASIDLLAYIVRRQADLPMLVIVTWRDEPGDEAAAGAGRLRRLLAEAQRAGTGHLITLERWTAAEVAEALTARTAGIERDGALAGRLYDETDGLPFFVTEYLALPPARAEGWTMPPTVRDLLLSRLDEVDQTGRQLLQTAAVIGRSFEYDTLREASGRSEDEVVAGLEALLARGLVREVAGTPGDPGGGDLRYDFGHPQMRSLVYEDLHLARRRLLHRRVAAALQNRSRGPARDAGAALIGYHLRLGGQEPEAAVEYGHAGDFARCLYANREALEHYQTALALGHPDPAALYEHCGDIHTLLGQYSAALHAYESAAALAGDPAPARVEHKLGLVYERRGDWELAESHYAAARERWRVTGDTAALARLHGDWSRVVARAGDLPAAGSLAREALALAVTSNDAAAEAQAHNTLGILARQSGDLGAARDHLTHSLRLAEDRGDEGARVAALNNLARAQATGGNPEGALALIDHALEICARQGDRHHEAALRNHRADLLHQLGREDEALASLKAAVAIYAEIGLEAGDWQPEIWKLAEW
jgi:DNA-binding SARP family transcriptional activator/Flp pilus assembly protein TadD